MRNPLSKFLKQYLYFTKRDRNAIIIFVILITTGIVINEIIKHIPAKSDYDYFKFAKELEEWEKNQLAKEKSLKTLFPFNPNTISEKGLDSLLLPDFVIRNLLSYRDAGGKFSDPSDLRKIYGMNDSIFLEIERFINIPKEKKVIVQNDFSDEVEPEGTFDPNNSDENTLKYFGFNQFQTENIIGYRDKGGKFSVPSDLLKIYGIDSLFLSKIENHILIVNTGLPKSLAADEPAAVELNSADSIQLLQLKGVGPAFASRIVKYRNLLGGFYNSSQLLEVYNFPEETYQKIKDYVKTDTLQIKKIRINFAQFNDLIRHPYLDREEVNSILKYRDENGAFKNIFDLLHVPGIDTTTIEKIRPYISCR